MIIFETKRLIVRKAILSDNDINLFFSLWTNPDVMKFVGFPKGLNITKEEICKIIREQKNSEYDNKLVIELKDDRQLIGECKLGFPDENGISETDVKILPQFWGKGYGTETKKGLIDYLFTHTDCKGVKATPNKLNIASQKMQSRVGGKKVGEGIYRFPEYMREYTVDVEYYVYIVSRRDWEESW